MSKKRQTGRMIKNVLLEAGLTQKDLADRLGVKQQLISNWVNGFSNPKDLSLKKIADATGKPFDYFFAPRSNSAEVNGNGNIVNTGQGQTATAISSSDITSLKKDTKIELLEKEIENLKLKLEIEQLKNGKRDKKK